MENIVKPSKQDMKQNFAINLAISNFMSTTVFGDASDETLEKMYNDVDIRSAINTIVKEIQGRKLELKSKNNNTKIIDEINLRLSKVNFTSLIDWTLQSKWFRFAVTEILWGDNYNITGIKRQLRDYFDMRLENGEYVWYYTYDLKPVPWYKAIISVNDPDDEDYYGKTDFEPLLKLFAIKENIVDSVNSIVKKYGGVITWFTYNPDSSEDILTGLIEDAANISNETVIPIPARAGGSAGYGKDFGFVPLTDLDTSVHLALESWIEKEISKYFLGGTLTQDVGSTGSYAASQTHQEVRADIIRGYVAFLTAEFHKLVEIDSVLYGYDADDLYYELTNPEDEIEKLDIAKKKADIIEVVSKNYDVSEIYVSEFLGIPLEYISKKENINIMQFSKDYAEVAIKKKNLNNRLLETTYANIENSKKKVNEEISQAMSDVVKSVKSIKDIKNIDVKLPNGLLEYMIISTLQGRIDIIEQNKLSTVKEFAEVANMFDMPYDDAIKYIQEKYPILYDDIDEITDEVTQKYFWVKESTSLELTKKIQKSLLTLLKNGGTFKEWKDNYDTNFKNMGLESSGSYTETIYRTNLQSAYAAGRYQQQDSQKELFPYWQYVSIIDDVTTDICTELNGKTYRANDPIWNSIYPPNHYNERSSVIALNNEDVAEMNISVNDVDQLKETETYKNFKGTTFSGNPVNTFEKDMKNNIENKKEQIQVYQKLLEEYIEVQ